MYLATKVLEDWTVGFSIRWFPSLIVLNSQIEEEWIADLKLWRGSVREIREAVLNISSRTLCLGMRRVGQLFQWQ